ncbi:hypothetical protein [Kineococcus auxinigenes]|uniref:hypothetical protein n=1 Tax=unclassified Kineococcus TaxID=2621656 RepID=UPI003D7E4944
MQTRRLPLATGVVLCALTSLTLSAAHLLNHATVNHRLLDADLENNVPTWWSGVQFAAAALAALWAVGAVAGRRRVAWLGVAALCTALSLDEVASLHEHAGRRLGAETTLSLTQPLAALAVAVGLLVVARLTGGAAGRVLVLTTAVLLTSQTCASVAGLFATGRTTFLLEAAEDLTESLTGCGLLLAGLLAAGRRVDVRPTALRVELLEWWGAPGGGDGRNPRPAHRRESRVPASSSSR